MASNRRANQRITLLMLVLASITVLTLDYHGTVSHAITHIRNGVRDALSPMQRGVAAALHPVGDVFSGMFNYGSLETENQQLRTELGSLRREVSSAGFTTTEGSQVLALDHLPYVAGIPMVTGEVIQAATSNFQETVEILPGTSSGVGPGMPVVSTGGLVGTVGTASSSTATVILVDNAGVSTPVRIGTDGLYRALGQGRAKPLLLSYVGGSTSIHDGQVAYTSGLGGGGLPAGIPVGVVSSVKVSPAGNTTAVTVTPIVNFDQLQYVDVLEWLEPA